MNTQSIKYCGNNVLFLEEEIQSNKENQGYQVVIGPSCAHDEDERIKSPRCHIIYNLVFSILIENLFKNLPQ